MQRFLVMAIRRPDCDPDVVQPHKDYLEGLRAGGTLELSGPFVGQGGGAYLLRAASLQEAVDIVHADPAYTSGGWDLTVYEWQAR
ncbi:MULTISPECIES: YciI family protein [Dyella]|uniref:YCII-related domain-containing protein n=2 Tax=Dyella TaxID=231454 RepID=A0A4R0Z067_9GAMM|nr:MULTISPECIES: YciI family protein [Dyella]TBR39923.1 hypothetical protein EYV96_06995 [Dyella terrae]TCI12496.1 hypothetical protein EZM97_03875 [Dyella soli]